MLTICFFYCIPFAKGLFFAFSPLLVLFSLFALKRGIRQSRLALRQTAFFLMFLAFLKIFTLDIYFLRETLLCDWMKSGCDENGFRMLQVGGLAALALASFFLLNIYRGFIHNKRQMEKTPEQVGLRLWAHLSMLLVMALTVWLAAPWAGYLTVGHAPEFFIQMPWQYLALLNTAVLLVGFWKLEDCVWIYNPAEKSRKKHLHNTWTAKDTFWLSFILFLIATALSYVSHDVLSAAAPKPGASHLRMEDIDIRSLEEKFHLPGQ